MIKTHSREWFLQQIAAAKKGIEQWPEWMKEGKTVATASFPRVGEETGEKQVNQEKQSTEGKMKTS